MRTPTFFLIGVILLAVAVQPTAAGKAAPAGATGGAFDNADFAAPDYANGATGAVTIGTAKTFNVQCHCSSSRNCNGNIRLQIDTGSGFANEYSSACSITKGASCSASYTKTFSAAGTYQFRVFCDENTGTDFTQPSNEYVTVTAAPACIDGESRLCSLQQGVCQGAQQTCSAGAWSACDYGSSYESYERSLQDSLDNDCDGQTDEQENQVVWAGANDDVGNVSVLGYDAASGVYKTLWSTAIPSTALVGGGEAGDLNNDGIMDFVLSRRLSSGQERLEVWSYDAASASWYLLWSFTSGSSGMQFYVGDIKDFDGDGRNELLVTRRDIGTVGLFQSDTVGATTFDWTPVISCGSVIYIPTGADLNGNGIPEIFKQCAAGTPIQVYEYDIGSQTYRWTANVTPPLSSSGGAALIDDMEGGDVNRDGVDDAVFCGNTGRSSVISYVGGYYAVIFNSTATPGGQFTQTCSIGDVNNDGYNEFFDMTYSYGARVWRYDGVSFGSLWTENVNIVGEAGLGGSSVGDSDNDGKNEFFAVKQALSNGWVGLYQSDTVNAASFGRSDWSSKINGCANIIVAKLMS